MLALTRFGIIRECEQQGCQQQTATHNEQSRTEYLLYLVLEEHADDAYRYHRHDDVEEILGLVVHLKLEESFQYPVYLLPQYHERTHHCSNVHQYGECQILLAFDAEEIRAYSEMTTTTYRQIFGKALNNAQDQCL